MPRKKKVWMDDKKDDSPTLTCTKCGYKSKNLKDFRAVNHKLVCKKCIEREGMEVTPPEPYKGKKKKKGYGIKGEYVCPVCFRHYKREKWLKKHLEKSGEKCILFDFEAKDNDRGED